MSNYRLGVDIGGTFTDLVMMDEATGKLRLIKMSSTPRDPSIGFMNVTERVLKESTVDPARVSYLVHGTTVATNTIIEGKGAKTAFIATEGFRDVFEIGRQIRPTLYDIFCDKPKPLIPRYLCREASERLDFAGDVLTPLDRESVRDAVRQFKIEGVESIAVCLLHAYVNAEHERQVKEIIDDEMPGVFVSISSDLCPEMREYFRASTTAINSLLMPIVTRYIGQLETRLESLGVKAGLHLMTSAGGMSSSEVARKEPVHLIESGPAAGVIASTYIGKMAGVENLISFDMGGTTTKVGLVEDGIPKVAPHFEVGSAAVADNRAAGYPVRTPVIDLVEIGAGGGSIAWVDPGGALRVGPRSGGADPGPACYGKGQESPCITDANLLLGRLNPDYFIGGEQKLYPELAESAIKNISDRLGMNTIEAANGIIQIANASMVGAIRLISVQRGFDPREFVLVAFGGAGPLHANDLAQELGIPKVLIPMSPGVTSALGLLVSDVKHDYVQASIAPMEAVDLQANSRVFEDLEQRARQVLSSEGIPASDISFLRYLDMRYVGQSYELKIPIENRPLEPDDKKEINAAFFKEHERAYGYAADNEPTEMVNLRLTAIGSISKPTLRELEAGDGDSSSAVKAERPVYFSQLGESVTCKIYDRYKLKSNDRIDGPAMVEEIDSTVVILPGYEAGVDHFGNLIIEER